MIMLVSMGKVITKRTNVQNELATTENVMLPALAAIQVETADERLSNWLRRLGPNTARAYSRDLMHLARHLGCETIGPALLGLCDVKHATALAALERYRDDMLAAGLASATVNRRLSAANSALAQLAKADLGHGRLDVSPVPHEARRDTRGPSIGKVARVVEELANDTSPAAVRDLAIVLLAAQRGLRRSEIANLKLEDIQLANCKIMVRRKGRREQVAADIAGATCEALERWLEIRPAIAGQDVDAVFVAVGNKWSGRSIGHNAVYDVIRKAGASIGATWHPHDLRHSAITEALRLTNGSLPAAQAFAGHSAPQTTSRYIDDKGRLELQAVEAMGHVFTLPPK
jgi:site-specific recombinase XerC